MNLCAYTQDSTNVAFEEFQQDLYGSVMMEAHAASTIITELCQITCPSPGFMEFKIELSRLDSNVILFKQSYPLNFTSSGYSSSKTRWLSISRNPAASLMDDHVTLYFSEQIFFSATSSSSEQRLTRFR